MDKDFATLYAEEEAAAKANPGAVETDETDETEETTEGSEEETTEDAEEGSEESEEESEEDSESESDEESESEDDTESEEKEETKSVKKTDDQKTFEKMKKVRLELKKALESGASAQKIVDRFDSIAKKLGFKDYNDLADKTDEKLIEQEAQKTGRSVEDIKKDIERDNKIADLENRLSQKDQDEIEERYSNVVKDFISSNKLSNDEVESIEKQIASDGFTLNMLQSMQQKPLKRLFESYLSRKSDKQKELEEKAKLKKEVPLEQSSNQVDSEKEEEEKLYNRLTHKSE